MERSRSTIIGLDLMGTIVHDPYRESLVDATGSTLEDLAELRTPGLWESFERGEIDEAAYAQRFFASPGTGRFDAAAFRESLLTRVRFLDGMEALLGELARRAPIDVMSNYPVWYQDVRAKLGLDRFVRSHHVSYELGCRKPDARYFHLVLERMGCAPEALVFVDDREENVEAARRVGVRAILFHDADDLRARLDF